VAAAEDLIALALRQAGWRQGDLIPPADAVGLLAQSIDSCGTLASDTPWLIVLTQDCDLLRSCDSEPYVELLAARVVPQCERSLEAGESARRMQLRTQSVAGVVGLDCSIHHRFRVAKVALVALKRQTETSLVDDARRNLRKWLARRYARRPFPDTVSPPDGVDEA
jgi:hypothetical protein